jgi:hypothetical protein
MRAKIAGKDNLLFAVTSSKKDLEYLVPISLYLYDVFFICAAYQNQFPDYGKGTCLRSIRDSFLHVIERK